MLAAKSAPLFAGPARIASHVLVQHARGNRDATVVHTAQVRWLHMRIPHSRLG